jgi:peptide deformylase
LRLPRAGITVAVPDTMPLKIVQYGDPVLRKKGAPVTKFDARLARLADDMVEAMHAARGIGLAAQQVGLPVQLTVIDLRGSESPSSWLLDGATPPLELIMPMALVNPMVEATPKPTTVYEEGCLSFPDIHGDVVRPDHIRVEFQDTKGQRHVMECTGLLSRCIQHEVDHLHGVLYIDRMAKDVRDGLGEVLKKLKRANRPKR